MSVCGARMPRHRATIQQQRTTIQALKRLAQQEEVA
jgi:hypothetical protein